MFSVLTKKKKKRALAQISNLALDKQVWDKHSSVLSCLGDAPLIISWLQQKPDVHVFPLVSALHSPREECSAFWTCPCDDTVTMNITPVHDPEASSPALLTNFTEQKTNLCWSSCFLQHGSSLNGVRSLSEFSPQWGNRYILVWVNSPQTVGRYGADWARTANKSPPAVLKWRGCEWGGKGAVSEG